MEDRLENFATLHDHAVSSISVHMQEVRSGEQDHDDALDNVFSHLSGLSNIKFLRGCLVCSVLEIKTRLVRKLATRQERNTCQGPGGKRSGIGLTRTTLVGV